MTDTPSLDEDEPQTLEEAVRLEVSLLWSDMTSAIRDAINTEWSIRCGWLAGRIVTLSRFVGPTPWEEIDVDLLRNGVYARVYGEASIEYPPIDFVRVEEVHRRIQERLRDLR